MHTEAAIRHKLKQVKFRYLKKRLEKALSQCSGNCVHNSPIKLRTGTTLGVCAHTEYLGTICDDENAYGNRARICPKFQSKNHKEDTKAVFSSELSAMSLPDIAAQYPDMAALLWVLSEETVPTEDPEVAPQYGMPSKTDLVDPPFDPDYDPTAPAEPLSPIVQEAVDKYMQEHPVSPYRPIVAPTEASTAKDNYQEFLDSVDPPEPTSETWHPWYTKLWLWLAKLNTLSAAL